MCVFCLYVCCAATDPGDPGIFRCKKNLKVEGCREQILSKESKQEGSTKQLNVETTAQKQFEGSKDSVYTRGELHSKHESERLPCNSVPCLAVLLSWCGMSCMCNWCQSHEQSSEQQMGEEGMFYCSLCEVEVCQKCKNIQNHVIFHPFALYFFLEHSPEISLLVILLKLLRSISFGLLFISCALKY